jgi:hypothetical protein
VVACEFTRPSCLAIEASALYADEAMPEDPKAGPLGVEPSDGPLPNGLVLHEDETVILALRPSPGWVVLVNKIASFGLYGVWWKATAFVLTDQRLIYRRGVFNTIERSLPIRFIQDATVVTRWTGISGIMLSTAGGAASFELISPLAPGKARAFKDAIMRAARTSWSAPTTTDGPSPDFTDTLRKLAELRDAGILTDEEFALKKADILKSDRPSNSPSDVP